MKIKSTSEFKVDILLSLSEQEARALEALTAYGTDSFLEVFYKCLGKACLSPHEQGLKSLFETIKKELPQHLEKADTVRRTIK